MENEKLTASPAQSAGDSALALLEAAALQTLAAAIPVFTQAGLTMLFNLINSALAKHAPPTA